MVNLQHIISKSINIPVSYAYSNDFRDTLVQIIANSADSAQQIIVCLHTIANLRIANRRVTRDTTTPPDMTTILAGCTQQTYNNTVVIIVSSKEALQAVSRTITSILKPMYDRVTKLISDSSNANNLIRNTEDVARSMGISEFTQANMENNPPIVLLVSNTSEMPSELVGCAFNLGCIDNLEHSKSAPMYSGLNTSEMAMMDSVLKVAKERKIKEWKAVSSARQSIFAGSNVIQDIPYAEDPSNIGGYDKVKNYMKILATYIKNEKATNLKIKGSLFVGPAGTGKSRLLTAVPQILGIPGFSLDINAALGQYQGQSEGKLKDAIARAKKLAPCVMCIDEIEKMLAGTGEGEVAGNEVAAKLLGIVLSAMAEPNNIYWVASANKISHLPAPLLRKGRFDYLWYVPLPGPTVRAKILGIHCKLNNINVDSINVEEVVTCTEGFTGAEIMHIVKETAIMLISGTSSDPKQEILNQARMVRPISVTKAKEMAELDTWAKTNTIPVE